MQTTADTTTRAINITDDLTLYLTGSAWELRGLGQTSGAVAETPDEAEQVGREAAEDLLRELGLEAYSR